MLDLAAIRDRWAPTLWDRNAAVAAAVEAQRDVHALVAEVERLRAALERIVAYPVGAQKRAREALEPPVEGVPGLGQP